MIRKESESDTQMTYKRVPELELTVGQILETTAKLDGLKSKLVEVMLIKGVNSSSQLYNYNGEWFKINIRVDRDGSTSKGVEGKTDEKLMLEGEKQV